MNYRHIVFDVDGTLLSSSLADMRGLQDTIETLTGKIVPLETLRFSQGIPGSDTLRQLNLDRDPRAHVLWMENTRKYADSIQLFNGIPEVLTFLKERGYSLGIVTSRVRRDFNSAFTNYGIAPLFETTICADDEGAGHKPDPTPLLRYMELAGSTPEEILYIGDTVYDSQCAHRAGTSFALACWESSSNPTIPAEYILRAPHDLLAILSK